jgi:hypothetical protein
LIKSAFSPRVLAKASMVIAISAVELITKVVLLPWERFKFDVLPENLLI